MIPIDKYFNINITKDILSICELFFKSYKINGFLHARVFDEGSTYILASDREYMLHHFQNEYPMVIAKVPQQLSTKKKFYYLLTSDQEKLYLQAHYDFRNLFNHDHLFYMFERYSGYFEMCIFAAAPENYGVINYYLNNMDIFEKFKFYFKDKAYQHIEYLNKNRLFVPEYLRPNFKGLSDNNIIMKQSCPEEMTPKRYMLSGKYEGIYFTEREMETLKYLAKGYSAKEIAKKIAVSPRTAECFLSNIKEKIKVSNKGDVVNFIQEYNLF